MRSLRKHWDSLLLELRDVIHKIDLIVLTEVDVSEEEASVYKIKNYKQLIESRKNKKGGGIIVYYKDDYVVQPILYRFDATESLNFKLINVKKKTEFTVLTLYRPPDNNINLFLEDIQWWLNNATKRSDNIVILGDVNICTLKKNATSTSYLNTLYSNEFLNTIRSVTREEVLAGKTTTSCIDHINLKLKYKYQISSSVIKTKLSDHYFVALQIFHPELIAQRNVPKVRYVETLNTNKINEELAECKWDELLEMEDPDPEELYKVIVQKFQDIYQKCSSVKRQTEKDDVTPWVNSEIKDLIVEKNNLLKRWRNNRNNLIVYEEYKRKRNMVTNLIKKRKRIYIFKKMRDAGGDIKKVWKVLNFLLDRNQRDPNEITLSKNFETSDLKMLAESFNSKFKEQIKVLKRENHGPRFQLHMNNYEPQKNRTSLYIRPPQKKDVYEIIKMLRKTGAGLDKIRPQDVKTHAITLTPVITKLVQRIVLTKKIPRDLKISCITPLYKKGEVSNYGNYRPVGSMCFIEKIMEKYIETCTKKYLHEHNIIANFQYGFQPKKSTLTLLENFAEIVNSALDRRMYVVILWLDLTRAFETLDHTNMLKKFEEIGFQNEIFKDYFNERTQVTKVGKTISEEVSIQDGLVTGGINSPGWFNIYTYDIKYLDIRSHLRMFADDSCIVSVHKTLEVAVKTAQDDFIKLQKYFYNNDIYINETKTEAMVMGVSKGMSEIHQHKIKCHRRLCLYQEQYRTQCQCPVINYTDTCRYLGLQIDDTFKMIPHVNLLGKKLRVLNYQFRKNNTQMMSTQAKKLLYFALVESLLRYGVTLYTYCPEYIMTPLNSIQRKIINYLFWKDQEKEQKSELLQPSQLAKLISILQHFQDENFRKRNESSYQLRKQNFIFTLGNNKYGERMKSAFIPKLLDQYCGDFINETNMKIVQKKVKEKLQDEQKQ
ncbi:hypothetical protein M8J77_002775 [Diaphorina citri]|nr:hypothetical protein M8J77_002775 [Diaphorina citri]